MSIGNMIETETNKHALDFYKVVHSLGFKVSDGYKYEGAFQSISLICPKNHVFKMRTSSFKGRKRCPSCSEIEYLDKKRKFYSDRFKDVVKEAGYKLQENYEYVDSFHKVGVICELGHKYSTIPINFISGRHCKRCAMKETKSKEVEMHKLKFNSLVKSEGYKVCGGVYENENSRMILTCPKGHDWNTSARVFKWGHRCPRCRNSHGEEAISEYLRLRGIEHEREFVIPECRNQRPLPFDFIVNKNTDDEMLIEYGGKQHYEPIDFFGGKERFEYVKNNDKIKREFCKDNNIKLLVIPYWDIKNIPSILDKALSKSDT